MKSIQELKAVFQNSLDKQERDREILIKNRIKSFNERHKTAIIDEEIALNPGGKSRSFRPGYSDLE